MSGVQADPRPTGGFTARERPAFGARPALRFVLAALLTVGYVAFAVWFSDPWRSDLADAIGPVMAWVVPILLAYLPALVIGFMCFTLVLTRYVAPPMHPPAGPWPRGEWPPVTVIVAAYDEEAVIGATIELLGASAYRGPLTVMLADNNSSDATAAVAEAAAERHGLSYRRSFEPLAGKHHALNTALVDVTTPLVVTLDSGSSGSVPSRTAGGSSGSCSSTRC